ANAATTGNYANAATTGKNTVAAALGAGSKAKASIGCWIVVSEWIRQEDWSYKINDVKSVIVDGKIIKADTYYSLSKGQFVESE
ncbi:hypothetical protein, partial [Pedobacter cryoconitis]